MNIRSLFLLAGIILAQAAPGSSKAIPLINHRGQCRTFQENTLEAFQASTGNLVDGFECDVRYTKSGDLLVHHNESLLKTCGQDMSITDLSAEDRTSFPIIRGDRTYIIPTLEEVLQLAKKNDSIIYIHLKSKGTFSPEGIAKIVDLVRKYELQEKAVIFSSNRPSISEVTKYEDIRAGIMYSGGKAKAVKTIDWARENTLYAVYCLYSEDLTDEVISYAHDQNLKIGPYFLKTRAELIRLWLLHVDFIMKDLDL